MSNFLTKLLTICLKFVMLLQLSTVFTQGLFFQHYFMATIVKVFVWVLENVCWHLSDSDIDNFLTNVGKVNFVHKIKTICTFLVITGFLIKTKAIFWPLLEKEKSNNCGKWFTMLRHHRLFVQKQDRKICKSFHEIKDYPYSCCGSWKREDKFLMLKGDWH